MMNLSDNFFKWWGGLLILVSHVRRFWWLYGALICSVIWFQAKYFIGVNLTESLPYTVFLVSRDDKASRLDEYAAFWWKRDKFYAPSMIFIKRIAGIGGQRVTVVDRKVFVDGRYVGYAKQTTKRGIPLDPISPTVIPTGCQYVVANSPDSLDSRYSVTGLVCQDRLVGRAYAIF